MTAWTGWLLVALLIATIALPYLLRQVATLPGIDSATPMVERLRSHAWLGYILVPMTLVHLWPSMSEGWVRGVDQLGIWVGTAAWALIVVQVSLGLQLREARGAQHRRLLHAHFWTMGAIALLVVGHVALVHT